MSIKPPFATVTFPGTPDRRIRGPHPAHAGWLHNWFANDPWIAWPVAGLAAVLLVFVLIGRLFFRAIGDVPWWARLGLIGAGFVWWRNRRRKVGQARTHPERWIDLRDFRTPDGRGGDL